MQEYSLTYNKNGLGKGFTVVLFIALFGSSMLGAQFFGVSMNKAALIPLELYLIFYFIKNGNRIFISYRAFPFLLFYFSQLFGSIVGLMNRQYGQLYPSYYGILTNNILQIFIFYLPILIFLCSMRNKDEIYVRLRRCIIAVARIHMVWVFLQFVLWYAIGFDLNGFFFQELLNGRFGESYSSTLINLNGRLQLRATGLNYEPAAMSLIMILGICFDKKIIFKILYFIATILGMSRTGVVVAALCLCVPCILWIIQNWDKKIPTKDFLRFSILFLLGIILIALLIWSVPYLRDQFVSIIDRFFNMGENKDGSERHILYPIVSIGSWIFDLNIFEKLFGVGGRVSGVVFTNSPYVSSIMGFNNTMLTDAWEIECDYAAILLGNGIIGFIAYFLVIIKLLRSRDNILITLGVGILVYGIMYNAFTATLLQVVCIILLSVIPSRKVSVSRSSTCENNPKVIKETPSTR